MAAGGDLFRHFLAFDGFQLFQFLFKLLEPFVGDNGLLGHACKLPFDILLRPMLPLR